MSTLKSEKRVRLLVRLLCLMIVIRFPVYWQAFAQVLQKGDTFWLGLFEAALIFDIIVILSAMHLARCVRGKSILIASGPYWLVAHPAYVTYLMIDTIFWVGGGLTNYYAMITGILYWIIILVAAYNEEIHLINLVGTKASKYYRRTPSIHFVLDRLK